MKSKCQRCCGVSIQTTDIAFLWHLGREGRKLAAHTLSRDFLRGFHHKLACQRGSSLPGKANPNYLINFRSGWNWQVNAGRSKPLNTPNTGCGFLKLTYSAIYQIVEFHLFPGSTRYAPTVSTANIDKAFLILQVILTQQLATLGGIQLITQERTRSDPEPGIPLFTAPISLYAAPARQAW